jgi:Holliday junction resolvase RusA-like endonuclease
MPIRLTQKEAAGLGIGKRKRQGVKLTKLHPTAATWDARVDPGHTWICIPELPPSLNEWSRQHWSERDRRVEEMTENLTGLRRAFRIPRVERPRVQLVYYFATRRHRDPDNYAGKFLLDGLRHSGIIADDCDGVLQATIPEFKVDRERARTEIIITEWEA